MQSLGRGPTVNTAVTRTVPYEAIPRIINRMHTEMMQGILILEGWAVLQKLNLGLGDGLAGMKFEGFIQIGKIAVAHSAVS